MSDADIWAALREPFLPAQVGRLPKISCRDCSNARDKHCDRHAKSKCATCGNYITSAHVHLDYVGHAATTDRLLKADPSWSWEPLAYTDKGLPLIEGGALWIKLTVGGVTRLGVGDADGKSGPSALKEMIGDAIRNAAMRFGVALDLWSKEDLHVEPELDPAEPKIITALVSRMNALPPDLRRECKEQFVAQIGNPADLRAVRIVDAERMVSQFESHVRADEPTSPAPPGGESMSQVTNRKLHGLINKKRPGQDRHTVMTDILGRDITSAKDLSEDDAQKIIAVLDQEAQAVS